MPAPLRPLVLAATTIALGCAPPPPVPEAPPVPAPAATFRVLNHLAWPFRLSRLRLVADGAPVNDQRFDGGPAPASISVPLAAAPGDHVLQVLADSRVKLTAAGPECTATLRGSTPFTTEAGVPAEITVDLYLREATRRFEDRLGARTSMRGVRAETWGARRAHDDDVRCRDLPTPERAVCHVEAALAEAVRQRDVIKVLCHRDKLDQMRLAARMRDEARAEAEAAGEREKPAPRRSPTFVWIDVAEDAAGDEARPDEIELRARAKWLEQQIEGLGREADQCIGEDVAEGDRGWTVTVDACFATGAPMIDFDAWLHEPGFDAPFSMLAGRGAIR